jgi:dTDP-4-amino-4,6-dideoxygalactose transaminase
MPKKIKSTREQPVKVPLLDLKAQYRTIKDDIKKAIDEVFESQQFILGPKVEALEKAIAGYCGCAQAVGVSSGTDALIVALMSAGIGPGHGVLTTPFTFFATAGSIVRTRARPFFVDIDPLSYTMSAQALEAFVEDDCRFDSDAGRLMHRQTGLAIRAVIPVHLYGQCADMDPILALARRYELTVIEDAAQAIGADYPSVAGRETRRTASMGEFGCFSFFPTKNLGGFGDGGMVTTSDEALADRLRILRVHGAKPKYYHRVVGGNFRLDALQAAVLLVKLNYLESWTAARQRNAAAYDALFDEAGLMQKGLVTPPKRLWEDRFAQLEGSAPRRRELVNGAIFSAATPEAGKLFRSHIYHQYIIRARRRDELKAHLAENGIGTEIYYPLPLHQQECFRDLGYRQGDFPQSEKAAAETLALPIYPELEKGQLEYVVGTIADFYQRRPDR